MKPKILQLFLILLMIFAANSYAESVSSTGSAGATSSGGMATSGASSDTSASVKSHSHAGNARIGTKSNLNAGVNTAGANTVGLSTDSGADADQEARENNQ